MDSQRINLLASESGITFTSVGLVIMRENSDFFERVFSQPPTGSPRDFEAMVAFEHEAVHFIQAITSAYLQNYSHELIKTGMSVLKGHAQLRALPPGKIPLFEQSAKRLSYRNDAGISCRDLLESTAVVESFKLADPDPSLARYLAFRDRWFPGNSMSPYRGAFDWLASHVGAPSAYELLAPVCFAAFAGDNPPREFVTIVQNSLSDGKAAALHGASMADLFAVFGMEAEVHFLHQIDRYPDAAGPSTLLPCAKAAVRALGARRLIEVAARPGSINSVLRADEIEFLLPPVVAFSAGPGRPLKGRAHGLAKADRTFAKLVVEVCALLGAAERLTILLDDTELYQFCPHSQACPHFATALCFRWFTPPSLEIGHENCGFPRSFAAVAKAAPNDVWNSRASPAESATLETDAAQQGVSADGAAPRG